MTITQMKYFVETATSLSFTAAAQKLYVTQQVVSRQVAALEKELDIQLFERTTKRVRLTPAGETLLTAWKPLLEQSDAAIKTAGEQHHRRLRHLCVGIADVSRLIRIAKHYIDPFIEANPDVELEYKFASFSALRDMLTVGEIDVLITMTTEMFGMDAALQMEPLENLSISIIHSNRHPFSERQEVSLRDLHGETFYLFSDKFSYDAEKRVLALLAMEDAVPGKIEFFDSIHAMELALYSGKGATITFDIFFNDEENKLVFHPIPFVFGKRSEEIVVSWLRQDNPNVIKFVNSLTGASRK